MIHFSSLPSMLRFKCSPFRTPGNLGMTERENSRKKFFSERTKLKQNKQLIFRTGKLFRAIFINNSTRPVSSWIFHKLFTAVNFSIYVFYPSVLCRCVMLSRYQQTSKVADKNSSVNVFWLFLLSAINDKRDWINLRRNFTRNWTADSWCWWRLA